MTIGGLAQTVVSTATTSLASALLALMLTPTGAAAAACAKNFKKCCTINAPGTYTFAKFILPHPTAPVCIDIMASDVILTSSPDLTGPGADTPTIGIKIEASANRVVVHNFTVTNFGQGIHIDGDNATIYEVSSALNQRGIVVNGANALIVGGFGGEEQQNGVGIQINKTATHSVVSGVVAFQGGGAGIELDGVSGAVLSSVQSVENKTFGIWLNGASNNIISNFEASNNDIAGVYLGCDPAGPGGNSSCPSAAASNGNSVLGESLFGGDSTAGEFPQSYGIAVGLNNLSNDVLLIDGDGNLVYDALDENPNCGTNRWFDNTFTISNPAPNTTDYCIN